MNCLYFSEDARYDKGTAKCLRKSVQGFDPVMVTLKDCAGCLLCFSEPPGWAMAKELFANIMAEQNRKRHD
jgi:hypothetical protein